MSVRVYEYKNCSTCQKALKFLDAKKAKYERVPIVDQPPTMAELRQMLGWLKSSGLTLRPCSTLPGNSIASSISPTRLKDGMTEAEALKLLSSNGKLIKRPFLLTPKGGAVGFKPEVWTQLL